MPSPPTVPSRAGNATGPPPPSEQAPAAPAKGWHPVEWSCELVGTAVLVFLGLSAVVLDFGTHSPIASVVTSASARRLLTGVLFASSGALVTVSPLGRRSGAHLNPAVTLAFWLQGHVHRHDLAGYLVSQCAGAVAGAAALRLVWSGRAASVHYGRTTPRRGCRPGRPWASRR